MDDSGSIVRAEAFTSDLSESRILDFALVIESRLFDRRIPMGPYEAYGIGNYKCPEAVELAKELLLPLSVVCTGNSLDMTPTDEAILLQEAVVNKEMEAAAIAWVATL